MLIGATAESFERLAVDAGVLIEDLKYEEIKTVNELLAAILAAMDTPACLGMTRGGSTFTSEAEMRQIEFDGSRVRFKGDTVKDRTDARIETTLLEFTTENLQRIIPSSDVTVDGQKTVLRERNGIDLNSDYMKKLSWCRELSNGGYSIFTLFNPMNTSGMSITGADKSEGELPVTFTAFNANFTDREYAPYEVVIFQPTAVQP